MSQVIFAIIINFYIMEIQNRFITFISVDTITYKGLYFCYSFWFINNNNDDDMIMNDNYNY